MFIINSYIFKAPHVDQDFVSTDIPGVDPGDNYIPSGSEHIRKVIPVPNSGASGTGDWLNPTDGLAENWANSSPGSLTTTIVTGSGFTGNAQRIEKIGAGVPNIYQDNISVENGVTYKLQLNYRTNTDNTGQDSIIVVGLASLLFQPLIPNTGDAIVFLSDSFIADQGTVRVHIGVDTSTTGIYTEVDEIKLIQQ
jgi:hypothetical protein